MTTIHGYAAKSAGAPLEPFSYEIGALGADEVEIDVIACGICHSDLSMIQNAWGMSQYPLVPGHEVIGTVAAIGDAVTAVAVGQTVGLGWFSRSCMTCGQCMDGSHNLCGSGQGVIVGRHGGFADKVRCQQTWAVPLPDGLDATSAGPLFCGGITVFGPIVEMGVRPTERVGVIGIGGLGHMALMLLRAWGCHVTAFTSSEAKAEAAREMGAHEVVNSRSSEALAAVAGQFDFILSTVNVTLDWSAYLNALAPKGRLHVVGAALEPIPVPAFSLIGGQKQVSGSPLGSPATLAKMLDFCARHDIAPVVETFPMDQANEAIAHLEAGKARYRVVLTR